MNKKYILERRFYGTGKLDLKGEQPPFLTGTLDDIAKYYYSQVPGTENASWETIKEWYKAHGWMWREKTW